MNQILIFILGVMVGGVVVLLVWRNPKGSGGNKFWGKQIQEKENNKKRILEVFDSRGRVANNEIQNLLGVSDASATRYLDELEKEGLIRQVGKTGQSVYYEKSGS